MELGADTLELDVAITKDGVVVVHHDRRLNRDVARGPDGQWVKGPAPTIHSLTYAELRKYDVGRIRPGSEYAERFPHQKPVDGTRIPRLAEVFALDSSINFNIEMKVDPEHPDETLPPEPFVHAVLAQVREAGVERRSQLQSFDWRAVKIVEREAPGIATAYLVEANEARLANAKAAGAKTWAPDYRALTKEVLDEAHRAGLRLVVWTVNEPRDIARLVDWGIDGIISDYPDRVIQEARKR